MSGEIIVKTHLPDSIKYPDIPGIVIRGYKKNEATLQLNISMMHADAKRFQSEHGGDLEEWLLFKLREKIGEIFNGAD